MVADLARSRNLLQVVLMRYAKLQMPSWKTGVLKTIYAIPAEQIRDALMLTFILIGWIALLVTPILFSLMMPTGS